MCRLALMDNAGIRYMQEKHGLCELFDYLEMQLGGHGNGVCFIYNDGKYSIKKGLYLTNEEIVSDIMSELDNLKWIIYHTRLAGSTPINDRNCHPFEHNGRVVCMNGNETDYTVVDASLTDTENILITTPNISERAKTYDSVFVGYENGKVFAYRNAYSLECIKCKNGGTVLASRFPIHYHDTETIYKAAEHFIEGDNPPLEIARAEVSFAYGEEEISHTFFTSTLSGIFTSEIDAYVSDKSEKELIEQAMENPVGSAPLHKLAKGKKSVVILADLTSRPTPSKLIIPLLLKEIRKGNPDADISILVAVGTRESITKDELVSKFGKEIVDNEKIFIHDCDDKENLVHIRTLPSGSPCQINKLAASADLLIAEGVIEPHFIAGFSGGCESVLPGIAGRNTISNDRSNNFASDTKSKPACLSGNSLHNDMLYAAKNVNLAYIVNVVVDSDGKIIYAVAGDTEKAHLKGCEFYSERSLRYVEYPSDIAVISLGGSIQRDTSKTMTALTVAETAVRRGGVIILLAKEASNFSPTLDNLEAQVLARIRKKATILCVSEADEKTLSEMRMLPAPNLESALYRAKTIVKKAEPTLFAIPDGTAVIAQPLSTDSVGQFTGCGRRR